MHSMTLTTFKFRAGASFYGPRFTRARQECRWMDLTLEINWETIQIHFTTQLQVLAMCVCYCVILLLSLW